MFININEKFAAKYMRIISKYEKISANLNLLEFHIPAFRAFCKAGCEYPWLQYLSAADDPSFKDEEGCGYVQADFVHLVVDALEPSAHLVDRYNETKKKINVETSQFKKCVLITKISDRWLHIYIYGPLGINTFIFINLLNKKLWT